MKLFYLTPKQFFEAVIIGLVLSLTFAVLLTTPVQVESPPVKTTPVPTPKPLYIDPTEVPTPAPTHTHTENTVNNADWVRPFMQKTAPYVFAFVTMLSAGLAFSLNRIKFLIVSIINHTISYLIPAIQYPFWLISLIFITLSVAILRIFLDSKLRCCYT